MATQHTSEQARNEQRKTPRKQYGRVSLVELDKADLAKALNEIGTALRKLERVHSPENAQLTRMQRRDAVQDALAHLSLGIRFGEEVLSRNDC